MLKEYLAADEACENFCLQMSALQTQSLAGNRIAIYLGLETLSESVASEGLVDFGKRCLTKVSETSRRFLDKLSPKISSLMDKIKSFLSKPFGIKLTWKKVAAVVAIVTVAAVGGKYAYSNLLNGDDTKREELDAKIKESEKVYKTAGDGSVVGNKAKELLSKLYSALGSLKDVVQKCFSKIRTMILGEHTENNDPHGKSVIASKLKSVGKWAWWLVRTCWRSILHIPAILRRGYLTDYEVSTILGDVKRANR